MIFGGSGRSEIGRNSEGDELGFFGTGLPHEPFSILEGLHSRDRNVVGPKIFFNLAFLNNWKMHAKQNLKTCYTW